MVWFVWVGEIGLVWGLTAFWGKRELRRNPALAELGRGTQFGGGVGGGLRGSVVARSRPSGARTGHPILGRDHPALAGPGRESQFGGDDPCPFPSPGGPIRLNLDPSFHACRPMAKAAPWPILGSSH